MTRAFLPVSCTAEPMLPQATQAGHRMVGTAMRPGLT